MKTAERESTLTLQIVPQEGDDDEQVDRAARVLLRDLRDADVQAELSRMPNAISHGAKSAELIAIGALLVRIAPSVIPKLIDLVQSYLSRRQGRRLKIRLSDGTELDLDAETSPARINDLLCVVNGTAAGNVADHR